MARVLIVCCGCRGQALARELAAAGHAVRGTSRDPARLEAIRAAGAEPYLGDPDRVGTLMDALAAVTVVCWLAGTAGNAELHAGRLRMLMEKVVDTPVRGVLYEAAGPLAPEVYAGGRAIAERARATWTIPLTILDADPREHATWLASARAAVDGLLGA